MLSDSTDPFTEPSDLIDLTSETIWRNLILSLGPFARSLVYSFRVPSWRGQEEDIIEDVVQETARRIIERAQKAERGEVEPIRSLSHMMTIIAQNYCKDLRRHDLRLLRLQPQYVLDIPVCKGDQPHIFDVICESVDQELLLAQVAREIANFPEKQRKALLIDLANRMCFDTQLTPLQKAFLEAGIQLEQYRQPLPASSRERSQHVSLLNHASKRVAQLHCVQEYILGTPTACN